MFGKIKYITEGEAHVEANIMEGQDTDVMNMNVVFEAENQRILGEVEEVNNDTIKIRFLGEFLNDRYVSGVIRKPLLSSSIRTIKPEELAELVGTYDESTLLIGKSSIYKDYDVCVKINDLFANHMAIFGNTGSGKSWGVSRLVQNMFSNPKLISYNANIFIFDAYGEYKTAFREIDKINSIYGYKFITTNPQDPGDVFLKIPTHLLTLDDYTLLLQCDNHSQIPIIERSLKLAKIFSVISDNTTAYKNHLIAKALLAILYSNETTKEKKNEIFRIIEVCHTDDFNFDATVQGLGYTRNFSECFEIDSNGNFGESVLINEYILKFLNEDLEKTEEPSNAFYTLKDFAAALEFTLISEGFLHNQTLYDDAIILKVRLNSILSSFVGTFFDLDNYMTQDQYIATLVVNKENKKCQIININLEDVDDTYAKIIVKILSRFFFDFAKKRQERASIPFHLFLEEAHRYVSKDADTFLIGYNIFERIAKEGRKYGVLLNIISQRPVEISETVISQCSNFLIFKMTHPRDIEYIRTMLPNISNDVIEKQKILQPGNCVGFGGAFKLPMIIKLDKPNPTPYSQSCVVDKVWPLKKEIAKPVSNSPLLDNPGAQGTPNIDAIQSSQVSQARVSIEDNPLMKNQTATTQGVPNIDVLQSPQMSVPNSEVGNSSVIPGAPTPTVTVENQVANVDVQNQKPDLMSPTPEEELFQKPDAVKDTKKEEPKNLISSLMDESL